MARLGRRQPFKGGQTFPVAYLARPNLTVQALPAFGAGYASFVPDKATTALAAFGAGYAQNIPAGIAPISPTQDGYAFLARMRTLRASPQVLVKPMPPPPPGSTGPGEPPPIGPGPGDATIIGAFLNPIPRVSESYPTPTVISGMPYADSNRNPWTPGVFRGLWAQQLQVVVGGEDVTFFRSVPTEVQSWASQEPFGDSSAVFKLPAVTSFDQVRQPTALPTGSVVGIAASFTGNGYWQATALGLVIGYGDAAFFGDPLGVLNSPVVGIASNPRGYGYALVAADGGVFCFGGQGFFGSIPGGANAPYTGPAIPLPSPIVGIAITASGMGYWLVDQGGQVYAFGDAPYLGNASFPGGDPATGIARTGNGQGYIILGEQGDIDIPSGSANFWGTGLPFFVAPFVGISTWPGIDGYVLVNTLGETYTFGAVQNVGGVNFPLNQPANSIALIGNAGYWVSAGDGGVFAYGSAQFFGSVPAGGTTDFGSLSWLFLGAQVTIYAVHPSGGGFFTLFEGVIADWEDSVGPGSVGLSVQCTGCLFQLDWYIAKPIPNLPFQGYSPETGNPVFGWDIAQAIPQAIQSVFCPTPGTAIGQGAVPAPRPTSPFNGNACVLNIPTGSGLTGILTAVQPAWDKLLSSYIQNVLAQAETFGGLQYTLGLQRPRTPVLKPKDFEGIDWAVSTGGHGIAHDLSLDITTSANAIYGSGTAPPVISTVQTGSTTTTTGLAGTWQGAKFPQPPPPVQNAFPLGPGGAFSPGDGQTGFLPFSNWMRQSGWPLVSQDTYVTTSAANGALDVYLILQWQNMAGLPQTGTVDVNTWNAIWAAGTNSGAISNTYYAPLWQLTQVEPYTYSPSGAFVGLNPNFMGTTPRVERYEAMGSQVSKAQGVLSATIEGGHIQIPAWTGSITLTADPENGSRFEIQAGQNILLRYFHGRDTLFHISAVSVDFPNLSVQLTVSSQPQDLLTLSAMYARDSQAHGVARHARPSLVNLNVSSNTTTFDSESSAGLVFPIAVPAGGWAVTRVGFSQSGQIAEANLTSSPATPFAVGVFSGPVTPSDLEAIFGAGGPLVADGLGNNPWNDFAGPLDNLGLLYGAGGPGGPCGFYPSDPNGTQTLTGRYVDGQTWPYCSAPGFSPWLWVAFYVTNAANVSGRFLPAPSTI